MCEENNKDKSLMSVCVDGEWVSDTMLVVEACKATMSVTEIRETDTETTGYKRVGMDMVPVVRITKPRSPGKIIHRGLPIGPYVEGVMLDLMKS